MVLNPIVDDSTAQTPSRIWEAIEERQKTPAAEHWIVTQPSHAALAADIAAALREDLFGPIDETVVRSIALHDAGWSMDDAEQIQRLRSDLKQKPGSFVSAGAATYLAAWTSSIDTAERFSPIGGYIVSRHFERLSSRAGSAGQGKLAGFQAKEKARQKRLRAATGKDEAQLERLVDALQFCDVVSLYLCCGSRREVTLDNPALRMARFGDEYRLDPSPFRQSGQQFSFGALRHPAPPSRCNSSATFYLTL
jgi:hypothetical protein